MPRINLLPWREAQRAEKQRQFTVIAVGAMVLMVLAVVFIHIQFAAMIEGQNQRNQFLENTIKRVEKEIAEIKTLKEDKKALLKRMEVIQNLQSSRPEIVHLFEEIATTTPDGVYLNSATRAGNKVNLEGMANSNDSVSAFMRQLDASPWLTNPKLNVIESRKGATGKSSVFKMEVTQEVPQKESTDSADKDKSKK